MTKKSERSVELRAKMAELLWELDASSCRIHKIDQKRDMKVYTVVSIALFLMILTISNGTPLYPVVSIAVSTGILLSVFLFIADNFSFASILMTWIERLDS